MYSIKTALIKVKNIKSLHIEEYSIVSTITFLQFKTQIVDI